MRPFHRILLFCLFLAVIGFYCGKHPVEVVNTGGSEVVGELVTVSNAPVADARIFAFKIPANVSDIDLDDLQKISPRDTAFSNDRGEYAFTRLDTGYFRFFAWGKYANDSLFALHDSVYVDFIAPPAERTHRIEIGVDTMRAPGALQGKVIWQLGYEEPIHCYIPGSSFISITDDTGGFFLSNVPAGRYKLYYKDFGSFYEPAIDSDIIVVSNKVAQLDPKVLHLSTEGGPPAPRRISISCDTLGGRVFLSWNKVNVSDLKEYLVFRKEAAEDSFAQIGKVNQPDTTFVDVIYSDSRDTSSHSYLYELYSKDMGGDVGSHSVICSVSVVSPSTVRTFLSMKLLNNLPDTAAVFDNVAISCSYANGSVTVDSLFWALEKPDSIVQRRNAGTLYGRDTLIISWDIPGTQTVFCTSFDSEGRKWTDSIKVVVIKDPPIIRYLSPDTAVAFNGSVRCSLAVSHRFGNCTLFIDLNRDSLFEVTRIGLSFDTVFNTNTDTVGGKIRIKIHDNHGNMLDTFFIVTIGSAPVHDHWEECDSMPTGRKLLSISVIDKTLYAIGGCKRHYNGADFIMRPTNAVEAYESSWTIKDTMKTARYSFASGVYGGSIYVFGGIGSKGYTKSIERYDPAANKWSAAGNMPFFRAGAASCVYDNKLYIFGGRMPYQTDNDSICSSIYIYDFSNNQWSNVIGNMKVPRYAFQALVNDNKIYLIGGLGDAYYTNESDALENVEIFNTITSQCSFGPPMTSKRSCFAAVSLNDSIFVIGGIDEKNNLINDILQFHPVNGMWTEKTIFPAPHPQGRHSMGAGILNGNIVIVGGGTDLSIEKANFADGVVRKYYP